MEKEATPIESLFEKAGVYAKTNIDLFKLRAIDKSADVVSSLASRLAFIAIGTIVFILVNIGVALWLGELIGKTYFGFFVVASFYALVALLLYGFRERWIKTPVSDTIILQMLKEK